MMGLWRLERFGRCMRMRGEYLFPCEVQGKTPTRGADGDKSWRSAHIAEQGEGFQQA